MSENPYQKFSLYDECMLRLEKACKNFYHSPRRKYMEEVAAEMSKRLKLPEVDLMLFDIHKRYENFPTMYALEVEFKRVEAKRWVAANPNGTAIRRKPEPWVSKQAPGTPPYIEAIFEMIKDKRVGTTAFGMAVSRSKLSEPQLWECYEDWLKGAVNELIKKEAVE